MKRSRSPAALWLFLLFTFLFCWRENYCFSIVLCLNVMFLWSHAGLLILLWDKLLKTLTTF